VASSKSACGSREGRQGAVRRGARPWRRARPLGRAVPGLPAALVEVMLSDLPPSPAAAATPGRFGIRLRRVEDVWRSEVSIGTGT
jgi:hypothetical protein